MNAAGRWSEALRARTIPAAILDAAPESPWGFPTELFRRRAGAVTDAHTPTTLRALEALPEGGSVLDVGVGGGATSIPLAARAGLITGFDQQQDMLESFECAARAAGVATASVQGTWPADHAAAPSADVVVSGHTIYNVADLVPFVEALTVHATGRVVLEATGRHPLGWMHDLWRTFHGIDMPDEPSIEMAIEVLDAMGIDSHREDRTVDDEHPAGGGFDDAPDAVALIRRRLCLPADRDRDLTQALGDRLRERGGLWTAGPRTGTVVTVWWDADEG